MGVAQPVGKPGQRLAQARRLLSVALARDLSQVECASLAGVSGNAWNEWERDLSYPRAGNMEKVVALFVRSGMPYITQRWIDYGDEEASFPRIVTGVFEVPPVFEEPVPVTPFKPARSRAEQDAAKKNPKRRSRGGE